jgi:hypothetical protein
MNNIFGVAWAAMYCFLFSFVVSRILDNFTPKLDKTKAKWMTFLEVTLQFGLIGLIVYGARILVKKIPVPGVGDISQIGELRSLPLMVFIFMFFQTRTQEKMRFLMA